MSDILLDHRRIYLPLDEENRVRITVRRKHVLSDMLHKLHQGLDVSKYLRVTFLNEPAVDTGGPLREFLHRLIQELADNNSIFCGPSTARVPRHSVIELEKRTFYYVGVIFALSLVHGGPAPQFLSGAVSDYIVKGISFVKPTIDDVPDLNVKKSLKKVGSSLNFSVVAIFLYCFLVARS